MGHARSRQPPPILAPSCWAALADGWEQVNYPPHALSMRKWVAELGSFLLFDLVVAPDESHQ